jgi:quercetin dioxygenase-like cupin family protein
MTLEVFDTIRKRDGFGEPKRISFDPLSRSALHTHDKVSFVYVLDGLFILNTAGPAQHYQPGETCVLDKNIEHAEEAGPDGAVVLVARK